ncbi:MAG: DNA gyrase inhibitor YacG [Nitratireductor sp.]|nr:DNA gyrase inhibitor YacG [Nitratireductor sp.]MCC0020771.1 DNA gyrase inhibitor YacG [Nitratireductor sp.]
MSNRQDKPGAQEHLDPEALASPKVEPLRKPRKCPSCGKPSERKTYPFCSKRCADVDLNRWFTESYAIPAAEPGDGFEGQE